MILTGKTKVPGEKAVQMPISQPQISPWTALKSNSGLSGERPAQSVRHAAA
jgi:hypothetical protein